MSNIILSICIPTYNRAECLENTIRSIVNQKVFQTTNEVEIIVSDNCSSDHTANVVNVFKEIYGDKILYFRNEENIMDKNFEVALSKGNGLFLKLNNDTLRHNADSLNSMLATIKANIDSQSVLFFLNQSLGKRASFSCFNLDDFINKVSYYATWIGAFGIWKKDFDSMKDFSRYAHLQLTQTDVLYRLISDKNNSFVNNDLLFTVQDVKSKGGYDLLTVFLDNYSYILKEYVNKNAITTDTYKLVIKQVLLKLIRPSLTLSAVYPEKYKFHSKSVFKRINAFYKANPIIVGNFFLNYYLHIVYSFLKKKLSLSTEMVTN